MAYERLSPGIYKNQKTGQVTRSKVNPDRAFVAAPDTPNLQLSSTPTSNVSQPQVSTNDSPWWARGLAPGQKPMQRQPGSPMATDPQSQPGQGLGNQVANFAIDKLKSPFWQNQGMGGQATQMPQPNTMGQPMPPTGGPNTGAQIQPQQPMKKPVWR